MREQADMVEAVNVAIAGTWSQNGVRSLTRFMRQLRNWDPQKSKIPEAKVRALDEHQAMGMLTAFRSARRPPDEKAG
jgi:hypothetical protein